jgi:APA family basic amino acid/polyamine antiporter
VAQMVSLPWATWERLIIWMALGFVVYFLYSRRRAHERRQAREAPLGTAASIGG